MHEKEKIVTEYMYEIRCLNSGIEEWHVAMPCTVRRLIAEDEIHNFVRKKCIYCGGIDWKVTRTNITVTDYFRQRLKDPNFPINLFI